MKKLNRKGFTLIELLAVIVIMAIILIVTVPNIIQSINDARTNSIHNLAVSVANTYDTAYGQDLVASSTTKVLGNIPEYMTSSWQCIGDLTPTKNASITKSLPEVLGLNSTDVILEGTVPGGTSNAMTATELEAIVSTTAAPTCSAIRLRNGAAEVLLVAANGGRFYVAQYHTYALSTASSFGQNAVTQ